MAIPNKLRNANQVIELRDSDLQSESLSIRKCELESIRNFCDVFTVLLNILTPPFPNIHFHFLISAHLVQLMTGQREMISKTNQNQKKLR